MPLGVLLLNHFAARIRLLQLVCLDCNTQKTLDTAVIAAKHTNYVSIPSLQRMVCPRGAIDCRARFPQLERMFGEVPSSHPTAPRGGPDSDHVSPVPPFNNKASEDSD